MGSIRGCAWFLEIVLGGMEGWGQGGSFGPAHGFVAEAGQSLYTIATIAIIAMVESTTTVQLRKRTAQRLNSLKVPGLTYDDVINLALDNLPPAKIEALFEEWQTEALQALKENPKVRKAKRV